MIKHRMRNVFIIVGSAVPFAILRNVILGRELSETDMGLMSLILTIVSFIAPISLVGQHNALVRFVSKKDNLSVFNWKIFNRNIFLVSTLITIVSSIIFWFIYKFHFSIIFVLLIATIGTVVGDLYKEVKRAQGYYENSILFQRSIRFFFPIFLLFLFWINKFTLNSILFSFSIINIIYSIAFIFYIYRTTPVGKEKIPTAVHKDGIFFWGLDISLLIIMSVDKFFIAKLTSLESLAVYFTIFTIMQLYSLAYQSVEFVLLPHSNKIETIDLKKYVGPILSLAILLTIFYLLVGPELVRFLYKGKYDEGIHLIPWFCAAGIIKLLNTIPSSFIGGRLKQKALKYLFYSNTTLLIVNIILGFMLVKHFQLIGAILSTIIVWLARTCCGFWILFKFRN